MSRITSVMAMHARDRGIWFVAPALALGSVFVIGWLIILARDVLMEGVHDAFTPALAAPFIVMLAGGIGSIGGTYSYAVGLGARRREYLVGTLAMAVTVSAGWAIVLGLLSIVEANVIQSWGIRFHFFHLPFFGDGSPLKQFCWVPGPECSRSDPNYTRGGLPVGQFWVYFVLMLFMSVLGLLLGSIYQRFGRTGMYIFVGIVFLVLSVFVLVSSAWRWWGPSSAGSAGRPRPGLSCGWYR
jgi:hypothetical protein